jgi:hypothetical protein
MNRLYRLLAAAASAVALAGCASTGGYNPSYLAAARRAPVLHSDGRVLVVTRPQDETTVYTGRPTSFTGSATTLTLPLGAIVKEAALAAFAATFKSGADAAPEVRDPARYVVIVAPRLSGFAYEYNPLTNVGFVTPTATVRSASRSACSTPRAARAGKDAMNQAAWKDRPMC